MFSNIHLALPNDKCERFIWVTAIYLSNCNFQTRSQEPDTQIPDNDDVIADDSDDTIMLDLGESVQSRDQSTQEEQGTNMCQ